MGARIPLLQCSARRRRQRQLDDVLVAGYDAARRHRQREGVRPAVRRANAPHRRRRGEQSGDRRVGQAERGVVAKAP